MYGERPWPFGSVVRAKGDNRGLVWTLSNEGFVYKSGTSFETVYLYENVASNWYDFEPVGEPPPKPVLSDYV
jgi:hypothetical protein